MGGRVDLGHGRDAWPCGSPMPLVFSTQPRFQSRDDLGADDVDAAGGLGETMGRAQLNAIGAGGVEGFALADNVTGIASW